MLDYPNHHKRFQVALVNVEDKVMSNRGAK